MRDGVSTAFFGSPFQCLSILPKKKILPDVQIEPSREAISSSPAASLQEKEIDPLLALPHTLLSGKHALS